MSNCQLWFQYVTMGFVACTDHNILKFELNCPINYKQKMCDNHDNRDYSTHDNRFDDFT